MDTAAVARTAAVAGRKMNVERRVYTVGYDWSKLEVLDGARLAEAPDLDIKLAGGLSEWGRTERRQILDLVEQVGRATVTRRTLLSQREVARV